MRQIFVGMINGKASRNKLSVKNDMLTMCVSNINGYCYSLLAQQTATAHPPAPQPRTTLPPVSPSLTAQQAAVFQSLVQPLATQLPVTQSLCSAPLTVKGRIFNKSCYSSYHKV